MVESGDLLPPETEPMYDKEKLGNRYTCFQCGTKFYDLNRPVPTCPECSADQRDAPVRDIRALLSNRNRSSMPSLDPSFADDDDDDSGLGDDDDDDDDPGDDDDDDEEESDDDE